MISLTDYAKRRGVSTRAVSKAVATGRLSKSIARDKHGQPKIADIELADREWEANTRPRVDSITRAQMADDAELELPEASPQPIAIRVEAGDVPDYNVSRARREAAAARREAALADMAELDAAERRGQLISAEDADAEALETATIVRTKILGVPTRLA